MNNALLKRFEKHLSLNNGVLAVAVFITLTWLWGTVSAIQRNFTLQQREEDLKQQISLETLQNQNLQYQQAYFKSAEYLELSARQHFDKSSPSESELILPAHVTVSTPTPSASSAAVQSQPKSNFEQWIFFLFGNHPSA